MVMQSKQWQANNVMQWNFVLTIAIIYEYSYDTSVEPSRILNRVAKKNALK